jgi:1,4-alpha-glucan branching enzyme
VPGRLERSLSEAACQDIVTGDCHDPFSILGMHREGRSGALVVRAFLPQASAVWLLHAATGGIVAPLPPTRHPGLFIGCLEPGPERFPYRLRVQTESGTSDIEDPYRFPPVLSDFDIHILAEGTHLAAYDVLGAHVMTLDGVDGVAFALWAPNAKRVSVVGPFNGWDGRRHPMRCRYGCGIWEIFLPGIAEGELYKFEIKSQSGELLPLKADPYAFRAERPPSTASIVHGSSRHRWQDDAWCAGRRHRNARTAPISIYEAHLGSWKRDQNNRYLGYDALAEELVPYVKEMGFTHLQLLPICEHPFDGSWGYQPLGLFAPTGRFGGPDGFCRFVERCHAEGLGLLLDWVPAHFPEDPHGLARFDGTHLYEHADPRRGRHADWGSLIYNYGRNEVANFLIASALFWLDRYHVDGLRVDAVASMLYLDYSRDDGEWLPNEFGGRENLQAIGFLRRLNRTALGCHDGAMMIAEESTAWPMVTRPPEVGGLGFNYKWNMGWMNDTLRYMSRDPLYRKYHHDELTFGLLYAHNENFVLPLSHDEVVHGKRSLLERMPGDDWQKFANLRLYYAFAFTQPGKKLLFMGNEFAQRREWNHDRGLDWQLLDEPAHRGIHHLVRDLNRLYRATPSLHELDCEPAGFSWIDCHDCERSIVSYIRRGRDPHDFTVVACNFTPVVRSGYRIGVPAPGRYRELLNTDSRHYGGSDVGNRGAVTADDVPMHGHPHSLNLTLPPLAALVLQPTGD